jgi:hypothetical protein
MEEEFCEIFSYILRCSFGCFDVASHAGFRRGVTGRASSADGSEAMQGRPNMRAVSRQTCAPRICILYVHVCAKPLLTRFAMSLLLLS